MPSTLTSSWPGAAPARAAGLSSNTSRNIQRGFPESITERSVAPMTCCGLVEFTSAA
jgi:hypothetical protein